MPKNLENMKRIRRVILKVKEEAKEKEKDKKISSELGRVTRAIRINRMLRNGTKLSS